MKAFMLMVGIAFGLTLNAGQAFAASPPPSFYVDMSANISAASMWGNGWSPNATVDIEIEKEPRDVVFSTSAESDENGDWWIFDHDYAIVAGDIVSVTDGNTTVSNYTVTALTLTEVDYDSNTVSGTAAANSDVLVHVYDAGVGRHVWADENGEWTADFDDPVEDGEGWDGTADLSPESQGSAIQYSDDWPEEAHGATHVGFGEHFHDDHGQTPHFLVFPEYNSIDGYLWWDVSPWLPNTLINITIGNPDEPDYSLDVWSDDGGFWMLWDIDYDIQPGDLITVDDGETTVAHEVRFLSVDHIDVDANIVSGSAAPHSWVGVSIHDSGVFRSVQADDGGCWEADFSTADGDHDHNQAHDIQPGNHGWITQEHDGGTPHGTPIDDPFGTTTVDWFIPLPHFNVNTLNNIIWGNQWTAGQQVTISIGRVEGWRGGDRIQGVAVTGGFRPVPVPRSVP